MDRFVTYFWGTLCWLTGVILHCRTLDGRINPESALHLRAIETNPASQSLTWRTRSGKTVTMPMEWSHIIKARTKAHLVSASRSSRTTRFFANRLAGLPDDFTTADGAGAVMAAAYLAGEMDDEFAEFIERPITAAADQNVLRRAAEGGNIRQAPVRPIIVRDVINGGGASQILAIPCAIRRQQFAASRGIALQQHLLIIDSALSGSTGSPARADAERNFTINARFAHASVDKWRELALPTFGGYLRPLAQVYSTILLYQPANGQVAATDRSEIALAVARVLDLLASPYSAHADAAFADGKKDAATAKGPLPLASIGFWMRKLQPEWAQEQAAIASARAISRAALGVSH
jgi:hypothetical protein